METTDNQDFGTMDMDMNPEDQQQPEEEKKENIFDRLKNSASTYFVLTALVVVFTLVFHIFPNAQSYRDVKTQVEETTHQYENLKAEKINVIDQANTQAEVYKAKQAEMSENFDIVLPPSENIVELTAFLEKYAVSFNKKGNPLEINNISYGKATLSDNKEYYILPVRMNIMASEANFSNFLNMISRSGDIKNEDKFIDLGEGKKPIRLMTVERINLSKTTTEEGEDPTYSFNVEINTFYRNEDKNGK